MSLVDSISVMFEGEMYVTHNGLSTEDDYILSWKKIDDDTECEPHVGKCEPGEDKREDIVLSIASAG